jgi:hypothetical protein
VKDISTLDFSTPICNLRLFNYKLFNPRLFNATLFNHGSKIHGWKIWGWKVQIWKVWVQGWSLGLKIPWLRCPSAVKPGLTVCSTSILVMGSVTGQTTGIGFVHIVAPVLPSQQQTLRAYCPNICILLPQLNLTTKVCKLLLKVS